MTNPHHPRDIRTIRGIWMTDSYQDQRGTLDVVLEGGVLYDAEFLHRVPRDEAALRIYGDELRGWGAGRGFLPSAGELERIGFVHTR